MCRLMGRGLEAVCCAVVFGLVKFFPEWPRMDAVELR